MPHIHDKIDFTTDVFIVCGRKVLLRKHDKYHFWLGVGGHIELDEDPNQAAIREVKEEVGLDVVLDASHQLFFLNKAEYQELIPPRALNRHVINDHHEHVSLIYFATSTSMDVVAEGSDKSDEWFWLTAEEIEKNELNIPVHIQHYAMNALKELSK